MDLTGVRAVAFDAVGTLIYPEPPVAQVYAAVGRRKPATLRTGGGNPQPYRNRHRREYGHPKCEWA